jgi:zinc D-Ala-D-Ala carboxypeptidase
MASNAWKYGFVMSYPNGKQALSCYSYEPWHYRYVGRAVAKSVHDSSLTYRVWLWRMYGS